MKRQFTSILLFSALLMGGASTFVSCKDYDSDALYESNVTTAEKFKQYEQKVKDVNDALDAFKETVKNCNCDPNLKQNILNEVDSRIAQNKVSLEGYAKLTDIPDVSNFLTNDALVGYLKKNDLKDVLQQDQDFKEALAASKAYKNILDKLYGENGKDGMSDSLKIAYERSEKLFKEVYEKEGKLYGITDSVAKLQTSLEEVKAMAKDNSDKIQELADETTEYIEQAIQEVTDMIPSDEHINALTDEKLKDYYTKTQIDEQISDISDQVYNLQESVWDILLNQVTGIIIQASESPMTGYENTPFGVQVGILGAYYGTTEVGFTDYLTDKPVEVNQTLVSSNDDNAGIIYVTVNPANVNPSNITLRLVDSQGNIMGSTSEEDNAPFTLEWANSNKVLKFGVSRAAETNEKNGFYAVKVKLNENGIKAAKTWTSADKENLQAAAKNILNKLKHPKSSNLELGKIASTLNSLINNRLTAYGIEASWDQLAPNGDIVNKKVTSELKLAATAISPLSFKTLEDGINVDLPTIPTLQSKLNFSDLKFNWKNIEGLGKVKTSVTLKDMPDLDNIKVSINGKITAPTVNADATISFGDAKLEGTVVGDKVTIDLGDLEKKTSATVKVTVGDITIDPKDVHVTLDTSAKKDMTYDVEIPMDEFNKIIDNINSQVGNMIGSVNDLVDKVNGWTETIDGQLINRINSYIKKFENALTKANSLLQPAIFYTTSNGSWNQLARVKEGASYLKLNGGQASTVFIASTYTAELLAPAYEKKITVDGGATLTAGGKSGSTVVLTNNQYKVGFNATKAGVYTITYSAVDYFGHEVTKTFFVKVVK